MKRAYFTDSQIINVFVNALHAAKKKRISLSRFRGGCKVMWHD